MLPRLRGHEQSKEAVPGPETRASRRAAELAHWSAEPGRPWQDLAAIRGQQAGRTSIAAAVAVVAVVVAAAALAVADGPRTARAAVRKPAIRRRGDTGPAGGEAPRDDQPALPDRRRWLADSQRVERLAVAEKASPAATEAAERPSPAGASSAAGPHRRAGASVARPCPAQAGQAAERQAWASPCRTRQRSGTSPLGLDAVARRPAHRTTAAPVERWAAEPQRDSPQAGAEGQQAVARRPAAGDRRVEAAQAPLAAQPDRRRRTRASGTGPRQGNQGSKTARASTWSNQRTPAGVPHR